MVHFYAEASKLSCNYWKLDSGELLDGPRLRERLESKNFATLKSTSVARLRTLYIRSQRGLLSYEGLPLHELKRYVAQRALPAVVGQKNTIKVLKAQLEMADEDATFDRFLDLPPELRCIIYAHHFEALSREMALNYSGYSARLKCQPPISLSSRDMRREALPLFYGRCEFWISISVQRPRPPFFKAIDDMSAKFIKGTSASNFARIRFLHFDCRGYRMSLKLDLTNKKNPVRVSLSCGTRGGRLVQITKKREAPTRSKLRKIAMDIIAREGHSKLRKTDLKKFYKVARRTIMAIQPFAII